MSRAAEPGNFRERPAKNTIGGTVCRSAFLEGRMPPEGGSTNCTTTSHAIDLAPPGPRPGLAPQDLLAVPHDHADGDQGDVVAVTAVQQGIEPDGIAFAGPVEGEIVVAGAAEDGQVEQRARRGWRGVGRRLVLIAEAIVVVAEVDVDGEVPLRRPGGNERDQVGATARADVNGR